MNIWIAANVDVRRSIMRGAYTKTIFCLYVIITCYAGRSVVLSGPVANVCIENLFIWCSGIPTNDANIIHESISSDMTVNSIIQ